MISHMKSFLSLTLLILSFGLNANQAANSISCTNQIDNLIELTPEECDPTGRPGPDVYIGSRPVGNNGPHYVIGYPALNRISQNRKLRNSEDDDVNLLVFLHGTATQPSNYSCLLKSLASVGTTIGLTYGFLGGTNGGGDMYRNTACGSSNNTVECLTEQHIDAIYGGQYGKKINAWGAVDPRDSISGRLGLLLKLLNDRYPLRGWNRFYDIPAATREDYPEFLPTPRWENIVISGHSQGASHTAYLAQTRKLAGATLLSGPQDECQNCPSNILFWIDREFSTKKVTAFAHGDDHQDEEPTLPIMKDNWKRMTGVLWYKNPFEVINIVSSSGGGYDVCRNPIVSTIAASDTSLCTRKGHCSVGPDQSTPYLNTTFGEIIPLYSLGVWSDLAKAGQC